MRRRAEAGILRIRSALRGLGVRRVISWGYRRPGHTHHWVMVAMHRALEHALRDDPDAPELLWLDNSTVRDPAVFDDAVILANLNVDRVDHCLPRRRRAFYLIHDHAPGKLDVSRYEPLRAAGRVLFYEVFRRRPPPTFRAIEDQPLSYVDEDGDRAVMLWATDLVPDEIDAAWEAISTRPAPTLRTDPGARNIVFVGSSWRANHRELVTLADACVERGLRFEHFGRVMIPTPWPDDALVRVHGGPITMNDNRARVREATIAPALQGLHQLANPVEHGNYVPCRIFKNISYGALGVSNNPTVREALGDTVVCHRDIGEMLDRALEHAAADSKRVRLRDAMALVASTHTYFNRLAMLLELARARHERVGRVSAEFRDDGRLDVGLRRALRRVAGWRWQ